MKLTHLSTAAAALVLGMASVGAQAVIVNLDATKGAGQFASETYAAFQTITLGAGSYTLSVIDNTANGGYNGYNYNTNTGIFRETFDISINGSPLKAVDVSSAGFSSYASPAAAISAFQTGPYYLSNYPYDGSQVTHRATSDFTLSAASNTLTFGIPDNLFEDNKGGVSLSITAAVPEPETYALMLGGLGLMAFLAKRRRSAAV